MPTILEQIESDYKTSLKAGQRLRVDTFRLVKAAVQRVAMEKRKDQLDEAEVLQVINQQVKQRRETLEAAKSSGRQDVLTQTSEELAILTSYLPQQLTPDALKALIDQAIKEVGPNQGAIMKHVMGKAAGAADGKTVSALVGERLKTGA